MTDIKNSPYLDRPIRTLEQAQADMARSAWPHSPDEYEEAARRAGWTPGSYPGFYDNGRGRQVSYAHWKHLCDENGITPDAS